MQQLLTKAKLIRLLILDVDGTLTPGHMLYGSEGVQYKPFHVHDGFGLRMLQKSHIDVAVITAKTSDAVARRMQDLGIKHYFPGQENKLPAYEQLKKTLQLTDEQIAYVGDDMPDLPILRRVGLAVTVADAPPVMQQYVDWVTVNRGGNGAVREVCDLILTAQDLYTSVISPYLEK